MIKINKGPEPEFLKNENGKWHKETLRAIKHYEQDGKTTAFPFRAYSDKKVKDELNKYFPKCAYCEVRYKSSSDGDIEHFRPKGRVREKVPSTPGYYWLANEWDNLLLSCQHCNQGRVHVLVGKGKGSGNKRGKEDLFPLRGSAKWATSRELLASEEPYRLLINPCIDDPAEHFEYDGKNALLVPKSDMAEMSIEVYALRREYLVEDRKFLLDSFFSQLDLLLIAIEDYNIDPCETHKRILIRNSQIVNNMLKPEAQFSGMTRFFYRKFLINNKIYVPK